MPPPQAGEQPWPDVTVVVPAYREAGVIMGKIEDLHANGFPGSLTVLMVVDDDSATALAVERIWQSRQRLALPTRLRFSVSRADATHYRRPRGRPFDLLILRTNFATSSSDVS